MRMLFAGRDHISSVFAFTYGRAKKIRIRYVWTQNFSKTEKKPPFSKISAYVWTGSMSQRSRKVSRCTQAFLNLRALYQNLNLTQF